LSLLASIPKFEAGHRKTALAGIQGRIPSLRELPEGCVFGPRCFLADQSCREKPDGLIRIAPGRLSACPKWRQLEEREKILPPPKNYPAPAGAPAQLAVSELSKHYAAHGAKLVFKGRKQTVRALNAVSFSVPRGSTLGVVGESGCGKTTLLRSITGLIEPTAGEVRLAGAVLPARIARRPRSLLRKVQMVFQNPSASLNPNQTVGGALERPLKIFGRLGKKERQAAVSKLLTAVHLPAGYRRRLPGELSGGELQRVAIARAFAAEPDVILLDEPLSALDVSIQAALVNLLFELQAEKQPSYIFISHDLAAVHHISDWIAVMYLGRVMEYGRAENIFQPPFHPYTEALLSAIPNPDPEAEQSGIRLEGSVPSPTSDIKGCAFHSRCPRVHGPECALAPPPAQVFGEHETIYCHAPLAELSRVQKDYYHQNAREDSC
jgi:peptide/nickel transport system ATP-binding protein